MSAFRLLPTLAALALFSVLFSSSKTTTTTAMGLNPHQHRLLQHLRGDNGHSNLRDSGLSQRSFFDELLARLNAYNGGIHQQNRMARSNDKRQNSFGVRMKKGGETGMEEEKRAKAILNSEDLWALIEALASMERN